LAVADFLGAVNVAIVFCVFVCVLLCFTTGKLSEDFALLCPELLGKAGFPQNGEERLGRQDGQPARVIAAVEDNGQLAPGITASLPDPVVRIAALGALNLKMNVGQAVADDIAAIALGVPAILLRAAGGEAFGGEHFGGFQFPAFSFLAAIH
jgi:hypothetical protein